MEHRLYRTWPDAMSRCPLVHAIRPPYWNNWHSNGICRWRMVPKAERAYYGPEEIVVEISSCSELLYTIRHQVV
ncbi:hypothetical protein GWI33_005641 [Rhynchophorus ferrugineus]|uniref:Uncharacterized protein n=1 Tax=Rhynchophorus ferrugineus TaxID=354439 RepID=A0A834IMY5_RHYFE|nr:hypothetical protein GWI33_005641 [Rhynchophorus ferrugineus]